MLIPCVKSYNKMMYSINALKFEIPIGACLLRFAFKYWGNWDTKTLSKMSIDWDIIVVQK